VPPPPTDPTPGGALLPIGRFARRSGLTVKALRHYDALGLLPPARTDPVTRHRWYAPDQVDRARRIRQLRALDLPLPEVRAVLAAPHGGRELLMAYRRDVEAQLARTQRILHGLVHLIEGDDMPDTSASATSSPTLPESERRLAADLFNLVWTLLEQAGRTPEDDDRMVHAAHASRYHWGQVGGPEQLAIGEWQCARVYSVLGRAEPALHHARRCLEIATAGNTAGTVPDWLVASAHEGLARAYLVAGQRESALAAKAEAETTLGKVTDAEDRQVVQDDLASLAL
jgi:DNA-binding transcriptional MerR regulator